MKSLKYLFAALALAICTAANAQTGDDIINKHIEAIGGGEWLKVNSLKMKGTMTIQGMAVSMTNTIVQNKGVRMDISVMTMTGYTIMTPSGGWVYMPAQGITKPTPLPDDQVKAGKMQMNIRYLFLADRSTIAKAEYKGKDTANGVECHKVVATETDNSIKTFYFDAATYNLVRAEGTTKAEGEETKETINYSNFQKLPEGITVAMTWGTAQGDIVYTTCEVNKPVDENIFKPTEEKK